MTEREVLKLALEWFEDVDEDPAYGVQGHQVIAAIKEALAQPEPMRLRRGDILRCIETDELCTVWSTSTTGKTLIKWSTNDFGGYTAEQIGELFWLEPSPDDLELAAEKSDNYAAFHAGYRFAVAHPSAQPEQEPVEVFLTDEHQMGFKVGVQSFILDYWPDFQSEVEFMKAQLLTAFARAKTPQRKPLTDEEIGGCIDEVNLMSQYGHHHFGWHKQFARAIEAAHGIKELKEYKK